MTVSSENKELMLVAQDALQQYTIVAREVLAQHGAIVQSIIELASQESQREHISTLHKTNGKLGV